jgi:tagaturonate reductase
VKSFLNTSYLVNNSLDKEIAIQNLPTKVIQFGTGVLLRGLIDDIIHNANLQGIFNGRVALIKSTDGNPQEVQSFEEQDYLFTNGVRGIENGETINFDYINSSISALLSAKSKWNEVIQFGLSDDLEIIVSNTTESGLTYVEEQITEECPMSFSGKLCSMLYQRFLNSKKGLIIIPTELLSDNGEIVKTNILKLITHNNLGEDFYSWIVKENKFCSSLVDRIVPGRPDAQAEVEWNDKLGYTDHLKFISEPFGLWAIKGDQSVKDVCSFYQCNEEVKIEEDINIYKELKLRLLNATHSSLTAYAILSGFSTVFEAMSDQSFKQYAEDLMAEEIGPGIPYEIDQNIKTTFAASVIDRFSNPFLKHYWKDIAFNYTNKIGIRIVPVIVNYYQKNGELPVKLVEGIANYLSLYSQAKKTEEGYFVTVGNMTFKLNDEHVEIVISAINQQETGLAKIFGNTTLWGANLAEIPGFVSHTQSSMHQ